MSNINFRYRWSIDQLQIISNNLDLDIIDWSIYEVMKQFFLSDKCEKKVVDGVYFYRYEWQNIPEQAPILGISTKQGVYKRYEKLAHADLLHPMTLSDGTVSKRFFRLGGMHETVMNTAADPKEAAKSKENYSGKNKKLGESNTINARLNRKPSFTGVNDRLQNDENPVNDGLQKQAESVNDGLLYNNTRIDKGTSLDNDTKTAQPDGSAFSESDIDDFESQLNAMPGGTQTPPHVPPPPPSKKKESKWGPAFTIARKIFDEQRNEWSKARFGRPDGGIYWNAKEIGQLSNLLTAIKAKATQNGDVYEDETDFVTTELPVFLGAAAKLDCYYSNDFSPTNFYSKFNAVVTDIQNYLKNGTTGNTKGRNGHNFDAARTAYMESLLD